MPRWVWFLPFGALVLAGALVSFRYGWLAANLTETEVIETYAARYMAQTGALAADCAAQPGRAVWLEIRCGQGAAERIYYVNRFGGLVRREAPAVRPGDVRT